MPKIKIIADSGADIPQELVEKYDIEIFSFLSIFDEDTYVSGVDLTSDEFFEKMKETGIIPTTAQTPYTEMDGKIREYIKEYDSVIVFTLSSKASGQNNSLQMIKRDILEENPDADIRIVDSMSFTIGIGMGVVYACELALNGADADEIVKKAVDYIQSWDVLFLVDNLKYLEKGGRINKASAIIGGLLDIKPVLSIRNGLVEAVDKFRGKKNLAKKLIGKIKESPNFDAEANQFAVVHANADMGMEMVNLLKEEFENCEIIMYNELGAIIGTHTGPDMVGVFFKKKK